MWKVALLQRYWKFQRNFHKLQTYNFLISTLSKKTLTIKNQYFFPHNKKLESFHHTPPILKNTPHNDKQQLYLKLLTTHKFMYPRKPPTKVQISKLFWKLYYNALPTNSKLHNCCVVAHVTRYEYR